MATMGVVSRSAINTDINAIRDQFLSHVEPKKVLTHVTGGEVDQQIWKSPPKNQRELCRVERLAKPDPSINTKVCLVLHLI